MIQKKFFNSQKKINKKYFKDHHFMTFNLDKRTFAKINQCVKEIFNFNESKNFKNLNHIQGYLNKTKYYSLNRNLNIMTKLENIIFMHFKTMRIFNKHIKGIQFPIDIRIVHPNEPKQLKKQKYLTSSIHCDTWTEEPTDIINVIIYLVVNKNTPKVELLKSSNKELSIYSKYPKIYKKRFFLNSKKYFNILENLKKKETYEINHKNGQVLIFNGFIPHQTVREGNEVRLSLEFRLKTCNPYEATNKWKNNNNHARYWFMPMGFEKDFFQRFEFEKKRILKMKSANKKIILRKKEIAKKLII